MLLFDALASMQRDSMALHIGCRSLAIEEKTMLTKTKLTLVATLIAACPSIAEANDWRGARTGLGAASNGPLHEPPRQGTPTGDRAGQPRNEHSTPFAYRGGGFDARAQAPRRGGRSGSGSRSAPASRRGPAHCTSNQSNFGGSGSPSGPYCFEN
jgi:hypothetical protein